MHNFLKGLNKEQQDACCSESNIVLTACPGSGKTRTVTYRLAYMQKAHPESRKLNVAITYTNRAADEIAERLDEFDVETEKIWVGTIHQFCMNFIIRPYSMYSDRLKKGYCVIDEYIRDEYAHELAKELGVDTGYKSPLTSPLVKDAYRNRLRENKEIDFDDILELSYEMLLQHQFIAENIASIISSIQVDEYQDTQELQYLILSLILRSDKNIKISFVGDRNQAIYGGLGGVAKTTEELETLFETTFEEKSLTECYRSTQVIVDFYRKFAVCPVSIRSMYYAQEAEDIHHKTNISKDEVAQYIAEVINDLLEKGISEDDICVVAPQWWLIFPVVEQLRKLLPTLKFDAPDISPFKYDPLNPFYLIAKLTFTCAGTMSKARRRWANEIINIIVDDYGISLPEYYDAYHLMKAVNLSRMMTGTDGLECYRASVKRVMDSMRLDLSNEKRLNECYCRFMEKTNSRIKKHKIPCSCQDFYASFNERTGLVVNTIHGVKGEEYNTVIAFGLLNGYLPHWDNIINDEDAGRMVADKLLFVLCSRAKERIYLISEKGRNTKKGTELRATSELCRVVSEMEV